uniref:Uncharacterized protein n=1 Tax=Myotis myotis TaxID=51298 RepID=A0A7J7Y000_MYOMY|nr:hypothetical protein mMyoMyo1_011449 [Myotis myotis]
MPRPRRLTGLITLNETQLAEGASGARVGPVPGDAKACHGRACGCLSPTRPRLEPPRTPGEPVWQLLRQVTFSAVQPGRPREGRSPRARGSLLLLGRQRPRQTGQAPWSPGDGFALVEGPSLASPSGSSCFIRG